MLIPIVIDIYGALGPGGVQLFRRLSTHISRRRDCPSSQEFHYFVSRYTFFLHGMQVRQVLFLRLSD